MSFLLYVALFLWAVASLKGDPLVFPIITFPEIVLEPLPPWLIHIMLLVSVTGGTVHLLLRVPYMRRRWRNFKRQRQKHATDTPDYEGVNHL